ncbi:MAG TPA: endonuclease/exonuclease/phosphatase family protein, partial [Vicinamibacteria bacterium]|nr:endonuclease/exonuclease/phosphatase family protein [Vicinamibacteria bacterium]
LPVRVYSAHVETMASLAGGRRREQAEALRADALAHPHVLIAGDFNARKVVEEVFGRAEGFDWVTRNVGRTIARFSWDHVIVRGFRLRDCASFGAVPNQLRASDHAPVWAEVVPVTEGHALDRPPASGVQSADCGGPPP